MKLLYSGLHRLFFMNCLNKTSYFIKSFLKTYKSGRQGENLISYLKHNVVNFLFMNDHIFYKEKSNPKRLNGNLVKKLHNCKFVALL